MKHPLPSVPGHRGISRHARLAAAALSLLLSGGAAAQSMVRDFTPQVIGRSGNPGPAVVAGGLAYFVAQDPYGIELWRTDGTAAGTVRLVDLNPGSASSDPEQLTAVGNRLFFTANVPGYGRELYVSDGTSAGTRLVRDIRPAPGLGAEPQHLCAYQGLLYFRADDGVHGPELWVSDGTAGGTNLVVDLYPGTSPGEPADLVVWNGALWFVGQDGRGRELYRTDGTGPGTQILVDLVSGSGSAGPGDLVATGGRLFFTATENGFGKELYATDGTAAGTQRVLDIRPGAVGSSPRSLTGAGSLVLFEADDGSHGFEPWRSDGTAAGTFLLGDLVGGTATSQPQAFTATAPGGPFFFTAQAANGRTLWRTDGTAAGTFIVQPGIFNVDHVAAANGGVAFSAQTATTGARLWFSNGTGPGTAPVAGSPVPQFTRAFGSGVLFTASINSVGRELFFSDGATWGLVRDLAAAYESSPLANLIALRGSLFFSPNFATGWLPWISNGSAAGTFELSLALNNPSQPVAWRDEVWFTASTPATSVELCRSNGGIGGTGVAFDLIPGTNTPAIQSLVPTSGRLFFTAAVGNGRELWATDGTLAGTQELDLQPGAASASPQGMTAFGNRCIFSADAGGLGREAWLTDGTVAGTFLLADLSPGITGSSPAHFAVFGNRVFFAATLPGLGRELCVTDGTPAGTTLFADLLAGPSSSSPNRLVACGNLLFFTAQQQGEKLFVCDGTAAGTGVVRDISPTIANVQIMDMVSVEGRLLFFADDQVHGRELWTSDGTLAGTALVADLMPGLGDGIVLGTLLRIPGTARVVFAAADHTHGLQLWQSDGTAQGTSRVVTMGAQAGSGATQLTDLTVVDGRVFFHGGVGDGTGDELWVATLQQPGLAYVQSYGAALCPGTGGRQPRIAARGLPRTGNAAFGFDLHEARANSQAALALGFARDDVPLGGCRLLVAQPLVAAPLVPTDAIGSASTPFPVPANPAFLGLRLCGQYLVFDPNGSLFAAFSLSDGLEVVVGG